MSENNATRQKRARDLEEPASNTSKEAAAVDSSSVSPVTSLEPPMTLSLTGSGTNPRTMPMCGLGSFRCKGRKCVAAVEYALKSGVRLIDTAEGYKNECEVAEGISKSKVPRSEVFIVTKVSRDSMKSAATVRAAVEASLKNLRTDYLDLVLIHWPGTGNTNTKSPLHAKARIEAWKVLQEYARKPRGSSSSKKKGEGSSSGGNSTPPEGEGEGKASSEVDREESGEPKKNEDLGASVVRHIGVSNFTVQHLNQLKDAFTAQGEEVSKGGATTAVPVAGYIQPAVNQIEVHPYWPQVELRQYCRENGIVVQAYTSLGRCTEPPKVLYGIREPDHPRLVKDETVINIAKETGLTAPQVLLRWALQYGLAVIPKASTTEHIDENFTGLIPGGSKDNLKGQIWLNLDQMALLDHALTTSGPGSEIHYAYKPEKLPE